MELGKQGKHFQQPRSLSNPPEMKNTASSTPNRHEDSSSDGLSDSPPDGQTDDADDSQTVDVTLQVSSPTPHEHGVWGSRPALDKESLTHEQITGIVHNVFGIESLTPIMSEVQRLLDKDDKYITRKWTGTKPKVRQQWMYIPFSSVAIYHSPTSHPPHTLHRPY